MCVLHSVYKCRFIWSERWSLLEKALGQCWHWKGFAPVCFRICLVSSSERANLQLHPSQEQWYGFSPKEFGENNSITYSIHCVANTFCNSYMQSCNYLVFFNLPVWVRMWAFKWELFVYTLLQSRYLHLCVLLCSFDDGIAIVFGTASGLLFKPFTIT